jgi:hypothetical protein
MTLLMRWSGLRIRDAITLERHRLQGDSLLLYQAKTGTPVYVPLPPYLVKTLDNVPLGSWASPWTRTQHQKRKIHQPTLYDP